MADQAQGIWYGKPYEDPIHRAASSACGGGQWELQIAALEFGADDGDDRSLGNSSSKQ